MLMPETFSTQLAGLAGYADRNASLAPAAARWPCSAAAR